MRPALRRGNRRKAALTLILRGILVSTVLTLVVIPVLYYAANWKRWPALPAGLNPAAVEPI